MKILSVLKTAEVVGPGDGMDDVFARLLDEGHEVYAVARAWGSVADRLEARGVRVLLLPGLPVIDGRRLGTMGGWVELLGAIPFSVWTLGRMIVRLGIDVVHTNTLLTPVGALAAWVTGRPHVWHARELLRGCGWVHRQYLRWVGHGIGRNCGAVVAVSESAREQFPFALRRLVPVIYDGLEPEAWEPDAGWVQAFRGQFPADVLLVGVVGRIRWQRKGQEVLVRAAAMLREKHPQVRYVLVGATVPDEERVAAQLRELITLYGLQDVVSVLDEAIPERAGERASMYASMDVLAAPLMRSEALDRTVVEAMAVGTAVVGSYCGGVTELVTYGETGLLAPARDFEQLARELELLLEYPEPRERLAEAAKTMALERFDRKKRTWEVAAALERAGRGR
jgi:glycosyltransferase involved in cell wall biosynthesis